MQMQLLVLMRVLLSSPHSPFASSWGPLQIPLAARMMGCHVCTSAGHVLRSGWCTIAFDGVGGRDGMPFEVLIHTLHVAAVLLLPQELLDDAQVHLTEGAARLCMPVQLIRKTRSVGVVPTQPTIYEVRSRNLARLEVLVACAQVAAGYLACCSLACLHRYRYVWLFLTHRCMHTCHTGCNPQLSPFLRPFVASQVLEELAISVQQNLISKLPFCAFNGGNDVFVDVGNKSIGLDALMRHLDCYPYEVSGVISCCVY